MANNRPPDLIWLHTNRNCIINTDSAQLGVDGIPGVGIWIWQVRRQSIAQLGNSHLLIKK
jgi:hypothetical protein